MNFRRIIKFQFIGWLGVLVNLGILWILRGQLGVPLVIAGACAIEMAIIHNFTWHYFYTWRERCAHTTGDYFTRLLKYNLVTASIDFMINLTALYVLTRFMGMNYLVANIIGMAGGPIAKFFANEYFIFRHKIHQDEQCVFTDLPYCAEEDLTNRKLLSQARAGETAPPDDHPGPRTDHLGSSPHPKESSPPTSSSPQNVS